MGATVQVNTSCQSVRFSRRPEPLLPVGINLTLLIPLAQTHDQKQPLPAPTFPLQRVCTKTAHSANSAGTSPSPRAGPPHRRPRVLKTTLLRSPSSSAVVRIQANHAMRTPFADESVRRATLRSGCGGAGPPKRSWPGQGRGGMGGAGTETDPVCVVAPTPGQKVLAKHQTAPRQPGAALLPRG